MPAKTSRHTPHRYSYPRCNFQFADGRRCRMLRQPGDHLCLFHKRELLQLQSAEEIGAELLQLGGNFRDPIALNFVLGKLFSHVATGRMHRRQASTLAYIAQLLLQTLDAKRYKVVRAPYFSDPYVDAGPQFTGEEEVSHPDARASAVPAAAAQSKPASSCPSTNGVHATHCANFPPPPPTFLSVATNAHQSPVPTARL
jgi:hypothetical protein